MANIKVNDIKPAGAELFGDFESFISDLSDDELTVAGGGVCPPLTRPPECPNPGSGNPRCDAE